MREEQKEIQALIETFPKEFGLAAFPGKVFTLSQSSSYWSEYEGAYLLYTYIKQPYGTFLAHAPWTAQELRQNIRKLTSPSHS